MSRKVSQVICHSPSHLMAYWRYGAGHVAEDVAHALEILGEQWLVDDGLFHPHQFAQRHELLATGLVRAVDLGDQRAHHRRAVRRALHRSSPAAGGGAAR
jgi:hypothetical protein